MASRWHVLTHLARPRDVWLYLRVCALAASVPLIMRLKLQRVEAMLRPRRLPLFRGWAKVDQIVWYTERAMRSGAPLVRRGCLIRGLTHYYFLTRAGLPVNLVFGMGFLEGKFTGHCWLVLNGEPYLEDRDPRPLYPETYRFAEIPAGQVPEPEVQPR